MKISIFIFQTLILKLKLYNKIKFLKCSKFLIFFSKLYYRKKCQIINNILITLFKKTKIKKYIILKKLSLINKLGFIYILTNISIVKIYF